MKKNKVRKVMQLIQLIASIIIIFIGYFFPSDDSMLVSLVNFRLVLWIICLIAFVIEFVCARAIVRLIYLILSSVIIFVTIPNYPNANLVILVCNLIYFLALVVKTLSNSSFSKAKEVTNQKTLPVGHFSLSHHRASTIVFILGFLMVIILAVILVSKTSLPLPAIMIIGIIVVFSELLVGNILINPLQKATVKFHKDIDFDSFKSKIDELLLGDLHPDSRSYLELIKINYQSLVDVEKSIAEFQTMEKPVYRAYAITYDMLAVLMAVNQHDYEKSIDLLEYFKTNYPKQKRQIMILENTIKSYLTEEVIDNWETKNGINTQFPFMNVNNAMVLMHYFYRRDDQIKAKYYAKYILDNAKELHQCIKEATAVLSDERID